MSPRIMIAHHSNIHIIRTWIQHQGNTSFEKLVWKSLMVKILKHLYSRWSNSLIYPKWQLFKRWLLHPNAWKIINLYGINGFMNEKRIILSLGPFLWDKILDHFMESLMESIPHELCLFGHKSTKHDFNLERKVETKNMTTRRVVTNNYREKHAPSPNLA